MNRILIYGDESYDLSNIKYINTTPYSGSYGGCYVNIYLLRGNEYVFNPETNDNHAMSFIKAISKEWEKYLGSIEFQNSGENE